MNLVNDRRTGQRAPLAGQAVVFHQSRELACEIVDIALGGIAVRGLADVRAGDFVRITFGLGAANGPRMRNADGVVARVDRSDADRPPLIGIEFTVVEGPFAVQIHDYVRRQREARHPGPVRRGPRRTGGYAAMDAYPVADHDDSMPLHTAPVTGEYPPPDEDSVEAEVELGATGTDTEGESSFAPEDVNAPIDREILGLYLEALKTPKRPYSKN